MFSAIALIGMTIERNVTSSSTNATAKTNANTYQMRVDIRSLKSTRAGGEAGHADHAAARDVAEHVRHDVAAKRPDRVHRAVVAAVPGQRDLDDGQLAVAADIHRHGLLELVGLARDLVHPLRRVAHLSLVEVPASTTMSALKVSPGKAACMRS